MISLRGLTRTFGSLTAVGGISLEVAKGEIFGLVGPDGAGKTTTLRMMSGLVDPTAGEAILAGFSVVKDPVAVKDRIGYMAQRFALYADLTVGENMQFYADLFGISNRERLAMLPELLQMTRMAPFIDRPAGKLSGGMKQKLALMCTLLHKPEILLLDEPTNGVDPVSRRDFWTILYRLTGEGLTLFLTTAYMDEAERCHRVGLMHAGSMILCDTPERLRNGIAEVCYQVEPADMRAERRRLLELGSVKSVRPAGSHLHVFLKDGERPEPVWPAGGPAFERITPSLEDVFVTTVERLVPPGAQA